MDYPKEKLHVYILDDGGTTQKLNDRDPEKAQAAAERANELKALAQRFGAGYITREKIRVPKLAISTMPSNIPMVNCC